MQAQYSISEAAAKADVSVHQVRVYLDFGLVTSCKRTSSGYRVFNDACVRRLRFIHSAVQSGLQLRDLADFMRALDRGDVESLKIQREALCNLLTYRRRHLNMCRSMLRSVCKQAVVA